MADVMNYVNYEFKKRNPVSLDVKESSFVVAGILLPASEKLLEIAQTSQDELWGYQMKVSALVDSVRADIEGAEQRFETFLKELDTQEKNALRTEVLNIGRYFLFREKAKKAEATPENFDIFKSEWAEWIDGKYVPLSEAASLGIEIAHRNKVPAEQIVKELTEYLQSSQCTLSADGKKAIVKTLEQTLHTALGADLKLYGKTLDDEDFDWNSLRGKYVLIKFTATWCGPCKMQIPGMLEAYKKYHSKGLEIISVYVFERTPNAAEAVASIKNTVNGEKLPWIILAEPLTEKAKQPSYGEFYGIEAIPTFVLTDKEGKIIIPATHGNEWQAQLAEIFK